MQKINNEPDCSRVPGNFDPQRIEEVKDNDYAVRKCGNYSYPKVKEIFHYSIHSIARKKNIPQEDPGSKPLLRKSIAQFSIVILSPQSRGIIISALLSFILGAGCASFIKNTLIGCTFFPSGLFRF